MLFAVRMLGQDADLGLLERLDGVRIAVLRLVLRLRQLLRHVPRQRDYGKGCGLCAEPEEV